jgi:hypothetical protein
MGPLGGDGPRGAGRSGAGGPSVREDHWCQAIPSMRDDWLRKLMNAFARIVREHAVFREAFGVL